MSTWEQRMAGRARSRRVMENVRVARQRHRRAYGTRLESLSTLCDECFGQIFYYEVSGGQIWPWREQLCGEWGTCVHGHDDECHGRWIMLARVV